MRASCNAGPLRLHNHLYEHLNLRANYSKVKLHAGTCVIHHCADTITAHGIGNGATLVICTSILADYSETLSAVAGRLQAAALDPGRLAAIAGGYLTLMLCTVYLATTEIRLPMVQYSTSPAVPSGGPGGRLNLYAQARQLFDKRQAERKQAASYFPILLNSSGMMPIILTGTVFFQIVPSVIELAGFSAEAAALRAFQYSVVGLLAYGLLIAAMEFLPTGGINPEVGSGFSHLFYLFLFVTCSDCVRYESQVWRSHLPRGQRPGYAQALLRFACLARNRKPATHLVKLPRQRLTPPY